MNWCIGAIREPGGREITNSAEWGHLVVRAQDRGMNAGGDTEAGIKINTNTAPPQWLLGSGNRDFHNPASTPVRRLPIGAEPQPGGGSHFRVWAPRCREVV